MELNFVTGRAGSGKSRFCIENIAKTCNENPDNKVYLIVPEQFTIQAERRLLENIASGGVIDNEVLSFKRLTHRVLDLYGGVNKKVLNVSGRNMLLAKAFRLCEKQLSYYKNFTNTPWNVEKIMTLITEFIRYGVEPETVGEIASEMSLSQENPELGVKLSEISIVYKKYRELLNVDYMDELKMHNVLIEKLETEKPFRDSIVWIDEFAGFTTLELEIIECLVKQCDSVNVCLLYDKQQKQLFKGTYLTKKRLTEIAKNSGAKVSEKSLLPDDIPRFNENPELAVLEKEFGSYPCKIYEKETKNIEIFTCRDIHQEVYNSALLIRRLCSSEGLKFKDISVTVRDIEQYKNVISAIYPLMGISFFMDDKMSLDKHPITSYILDALDIVAGGFRFDSIFSFLKSGYFPGDTDVINRLENEMLKRGTRGRSGWSKVLPDEDCEQLRKTFMEYMDVLYEGLRVSSTYSDALSVLCKFLDKLNVSVVCNKENEDVIRIGNIISEVFGQLNTFLGTEKCGGIISAAEELKYLLKSGFSKYMVGNIPEVPDCVQIGAADRSRTHEIKALIVLGANEGVFPADFNDNGILSDDERELLQKKGVSLSEDMRARAFLEQFLVYRTITSPCKYLYISYAMQMGTESGKPSWLIRRVKRILPKVKCTTCNDELGFSNYQLNGATPFVAGAYLSENVAKELFTRQKDNVVSVTAMEKYSTCPYKFFMENGLEAKPRAEFLVENSDTGSFLHSLLELATKKVLADEKSRPADEKECMEVIESVTDEALGQMYTDIMVSSAKNRFLTDRLKKFAAKALYAVVLQCRADAYIPGGFEVKFGYNTPDSLPALEFSGPEGEPLIVKGKIDRYDYWEHEGVRYYRVIDYKSYDATIAPGEIIDGYKMQLVTYLDALTKAQKKENIKAEAGGIFYFHVSSSRTSEDDYKLKGLYYEKQENVEAMVGPDGGGGLSKQALNASKIPAGCFKVPEGGFDFLKKKTEENIGRIASEIKKGKIDVKPIATGKYSPCDNCNFGNVCGFSGKVMCLRTEDSDEVFNKYLKNKVD